MTKAEQKVHKKNLGKLFPNSFISTTQEFSGQPGGLWTGFGEDGTVDYRSHYVDLKLKKYLDKHGLFLEPNDPGTYMIWKA